MDQNEKIVSFSERGSLTESSDTITNVQLLMIMEKFKFFKNFKNFKIEIANVIFRRISTESEKFFLIDPSNLTRFSETRLLSDQKCVLKKILVPKMTEKIGRKMFNFFKNLVSKSLFKSKTWGR